MRCPTSKLIRLLQPPLFIYLFFVCLRFLLICADFIVMMSSKLLLVKTDIAQLVAAATVLDKRCSFSCGKGKSAIVTEQSCSVLLLESFIFL
jgi:hypothetical protein